MDTGKNQKLKIIIIIYILIIGMALGIFISRIIPKNILLFDFHDRFNDYLNTARVSSNPYGAVGIGRSYFPFAYVLLNIINYISLFGVNILLVYFITFFIMIFILIKFYDKLLKATPFKTTLLLILVYCTFPLWFTFDRGNIEYLVFAFLIIFFMLYKDKKYNYAALVLAFPVCMKLYPAIFAILFLKNKKYKSFLIATVTSILLMVISYILLGGKIDNFKNFIDNFSFFTKTYALNIQGITFGHSIWNFVNYISFSFGNNINLLFNSFSINLYTIFILLSSLILFLYVAFFEKTEWKAITILTIMMISFPHVSFDYTLIYLYIPLTFFIIYISTKKWEAIFYSIMFSLIIIPMNWLVFSYGVHSINIGVFIKPLLMLIIIFSILISGYYEKNQRSKFINEKTTIKV